ncbi:MAG TPA: Rieske 2Fe-2S domain-containing protein [Mucilaginibacter sp.]|nr:Rieske 2Fe-2S domain-containing protein [Mucilaginibacter sp.]
MNDTETDTKRRKFLVRLSLSLGALAAAFAGIPVISALIAPLTEKKPRLWRDVGSLDQFKIGATNLVKFENADPEAWAGVTAHTAAWLRRDAVKNFTAFAVNCSHLGCPVRWESDAQLFMCPCHGGVYYKDGTVAAGPPPKSLTKYPVRINKGRVEILTSPVPITTISA